MCMPIPSESTVLDHFGVVDRELRLYIAVGANHPPSGVIAYLKYVPSESPQPWRLAGTVFMKRVLPRYSPKHVDSSSRGMKRVYDPRLGCFVPVVEWFSIAKLIDPRSIAERLLYSCRDELECLALELVSDLVSLGVPLNTIGVAGSIMFGIHNPTVSDIDIVLYVDDERLAEVMESVRSVLEPVPGPRLEELVKGVAELHGLPTELARLVYAVPRRGLYRGREVTVVYTDPAPLRLSEVMESQCLEMVLEIEPNQPGFLKYPGHGIASRVRVGGRVLENVEVLSYEAAYSIPMYFGGAYMCRALLQRLSDGGFRVVLGSRECHTYITRSHYLPT